MHKNPFIMADHQHLLLVFIKNPKAGKVKTRLAESVGNKEALHIYKALLQHIRSVVEHVDADTEIHYADEIPSSDLWDDLPVRKVEQEGDDLGARMANAFKQGFKNRYQRIVIIGSDCAELTATHIGNAFKALNDYDSVIGPSNDGGYYLLGLNQFLPQLFKQKQWSTPSVYPETLEDLEELNKRWFTLPKLCDIDTIEDWQQTGHRLLKYLSDEPVQS